MLDALNVLLPELLFLAKELVEMFHWLCPFCLKLMQQKLRRQLAVKRLVDLPALL